MKNGVVVTKDDQIKGVFVVDYGKKLEVEKTFNDTKTIQTLKKPIIGLPFDSFIIKTIKLPSIPKNDLKKTIDLQVKFNLGENAFDEYMINTTVESKSHGYLLFIVAVKLPEFMQKIKTDIIIPDVLGIYAYAYKKKLLDTEKNTLMIFVGTNIVYLLVVHSSKIVFIRSFSLDSDFKTEINLSKQAVYLQSERSMVDIDEFLLFSYDEIYRENFSFIENIKWIDLSKYKNKDGDGVFLALGMTMFHYSSLHKVLGDWNVGKKPLTTQESLRRSLFWIAPILVLFLPIYFYSDYYMNNRKIQLIKQDIKLMNSQVQVYDNLSIKMDRARTLMEEFAGPCLDYAKLYKLLQVLNNKRPRSLWFSNLTGKIDGEITVTGYAHNFSDISSLIKRLNKSDFIESLNLNYSNESSLGKVSFQLTLKLTQKFDFALEDYFSDEKKSIKHEAQSENSEVSKDNTHISKTG